MDKIRNFCIIAHIDHGKSTIADRMMELTGTVSEREMRSQLLDSMELEQERGITIKLTPVRMEWKGYVLNLIDTPGHVDFSYEVSRSLAAVETAVLVVDATQGIQAQTLANVYLAIEQDLKIIPVINKIDLPAAEVEKTAAEIINLLGCSEDEIIKVSGKTGVNIEQILDRLIESDVETNENLGGETKALIFDSYFDDYRGVVLYVRIFEGEMKRGDEILMMSTGSRDEALEVGVLTPKMSPREKLSAGEIGYIVTNLKTTQEARVGDTVTLAAHPAAEALPGYKNVLPFVYAGFFPVSNDQYKELREAVEKLALSDSALKYELENSPVLGFGLRIGFLGLLHMDIIKERLEREFKLDLIVTNPSTNYEVVMNKKIGDGMILGDKVSASGIAGKGKNDKKVSASKIAEKTGVRTDEYGHEIREIKSAAELPDVSEILEIREPWVKGEIILPKEMIGGVLNLINSKRGRQTNLSYIEGRAVIDFEAPMANLLTDFYDELKSVTSGYASFNYELSGYRAEDLVRVDFLVAGTRLDALSVMAHRSEAEAIGREVTKKLKEVIPRQNYEVALQAAIGARIIARETIGAYRKDVTVKIHTGDRDRKAKLLEKQKRGKARMKRFGKVDIPPEAFTVLLSR